MSAGPAGSRLVAGVFVGGASRRMGGEPKGWLRAPADGAGTNVSVIERTLALVRARCDEVVLVGRAAAYAALGVPAIADATTGDGAPADGPLAGLVALLEHAKGGAALALACDMPYLTGEMVEHLASFAPESAAVAPKEAGTPSIWSPLFARYDPARVLVVARAKLEAGERSLRVVLDAVGTRELPLTPEQRRALRDWDTPADVGDVDVERP